jgi:hypothetical protein
VQIREYKYKKILRQCSILAVNFWSVKYFGVFNFGTSYLGAKIGQNKTMTKIRAKDVAVCVIHRAKDVAVCVIHRAKAMAVCVIHRAKDVTQTATSFALCMTQTATSIILFYRYSAFFILV